MWHGARWEEEDPKEVDPKEVAQNGGTFIVIQQVKSSMILHDSRYRAQQFSFGTLVELTHLLCARSSDCFVFAIGRKKERKQTTQGRKEKKENSKPKEG